MPLFDYYIMVDWSGGARRRGMRPDTIWIAHGSINAEDPVTDSPFSRTEAIELIHRLLEEQLNTSLRTLVCFDFAYGYPVDFAAALQEAIGKTDTTLPWLAVWQYLSDTIKDDEGTLPGRKPSNRSNRFAVAERINTLLSTGSKAAGPFWCVHSEGTHLYIPQKSPSQPFRAAQGFLIKPLRLTDQRAHSNTPFRVFGTGSVGSQSLSGIPRLNGLRYHPKFAARSAVWPFETDWAIRANWLPKNVSILHAEIYPSVREPMADTIRDRGQVRSMWAMSPRSRSAKFALV